jgi:hypothetical protein
MRTILSTLFCLTLLVPATAQEPAAPDSTGLPGDDFSLQGALDLFKRNIEMEKFEEELNTDSTHVNNLDLDGNGEIDYVRVETQREGDAVYVVMKVAVSATESQDVAVIGVEKTGEESATVQIIGDEELYGPNTFVEPFAEEESARPAKGPSAPELVGVRVTVNVWSWRPVPWCFSPRYYPYVSPWGWGRHPGWWKPWRPHPWHSWRGLHRHHGWYRPWHACRINRAQAFYGPRRAHSAVVHARYADAHTRHAATRPARKATVKPAGKGDGQHIRKAGPTPRTTAPKDGAKGRPKATRPARGGKKGR